ncbi:MAG: MBL fold metallo-hydrolase, partial [Chloroflexota bacterium]
PEGPATTSWSGRMWASTPTSSPSRTRGWLIDVTPDFRQQMLNHQVKKIDAVLLTHHHSDHIQGFPDIRSYCQQGNPLDVYGPAETIDLLKQRFDYIFNPPPIIAGGIPDLTPHSKRAGERFEVCGLEITPGFVEHGSVQECFGYRLGDKIGYIPDVKVMPEETKALFQDLDILILNMLRRAPEHSTHLTLAQSVALAKELNPKQCYFVHMSHDIHYEKDQQALPPQMMFTYDGLQVKVEV